MTRILLFSFIVLLGCPAKQPKFTFLEGPPRLVCKPEGHFAMVGKPWPWSCIVEGDTSTFQDTPLGFQITAYMREEFPTRSLSNGGMKRVYSYSTTFDEEYYNDIMGRHRFAPGDLIERIPEGDLRFPMPPIEGYDAAFDGSFWLQLEVFPIDYWNQATGEVVVGSKMMSDKIHGRLSCPMCVV